MAVHESDVKTNEKFIELQAMENILRGYGSKVRTFQRCIQQLNMIPSQNIKEDDTVETIFLMPKNIAGDEMDHNYRESQQDAIIVNIDKLLDELKVLY